MKFGKGGRIEREVQHQFWLPGFAIPIPPPLRSCLVKLFGLLRSPLRKPRKALTLHSLVDNFSR